MPLDQVDIEEQELQMTFLEHLEALRWHIIRSVVAIIIGAVGVFIYRTTLFDNIIMAPTKGDFWTLKKLCALSQDWYGTDKLCLGDIQYVIKSIQFQEQFVQAITFALIGGFILALPYILIEIYRFIKPALKKSERRYSGLAITICSLLFFTGVLFGYYFLSPISLNFLDNFVFSEMIAKETSTASILSIILMLTAGSGIIFELPIVIYILSRIGIVSASGLKKYRKIAIVIILVASAFITPPDVFSQVLLGVPIYLLYEVGILAAANNEKKALKETENEKS